MGFPHPDGRITPIRSAGFHRKDAGGGKKIHRQIAFTTDYQDIGVQFPAWQNLPDAVARATTLLDTGAVSVFVQVSSIEIFADPLLEKVFYNLLDNATRHSGPITRIRIYDRITENGLKDCLRGRRARLNRA